MGRCSAHLLQTLGVFLMTILQQDNCVMGRVLTGPTLKTYQSSTANGAEGGLALDTNGTSCSLTGWEVAPWFKVDLGTSHDVTKVTLTGERVLPNVRVRVGDQHNDLGQQDGHQSNNLCANWWKGPIPLDTGSGVEFPCVPPTRGRYVSVEVTSRHGYTSLSLCDVTVEGY